MNYQDKPDLTHAQVIGMMCFGACLWAILGGLAWALLAWTVKGLIVAGIGVVGCYIFTKWLIYVNPKNH